MEVKELQDHQNSLADFAMDISVSSALDPIIVASGVERRIWAIRKLEREIAQLKELKAQSDEFYDGKVDSVKRTILFIESQIAEFIAKYGEKVPTPAGTAFLTSRTKYEYDEEKALAWAKENGRDEFITKKTTESLDRSAFSLMLKDPSARPEFVTVREESHLTIRKA